MSLKKNLIQKFFGYILLFFGIFLLVVGFGMLVDREQKDRDKAPSIMIFSTAFIIPGSILVFFAKKNNKIEEQIQSLTALVKTYRRITIDELALKLGTTPPRAELLLTRAISMNLVDGNFDRTTSEFYTQASVDEKASMRFCPSCGASFDRIFLAGETIKCSKCGMISS